MVAAHFPAWLHAVAIGSLILACACASAIAVDELCHPQKMWIMNVVWPIATLFGSVLWLGGYLAWGRAPRRGRPAKAGAPPFAVMVAKGGSHCGAGCALGDLIAEWLVFLVPTIAVGLGWQSIFHREMFAVWILDYLVAFLIGVGFQYFTIKPMRHLSVGKASGKR